jgi:hypothetical protein
MWRSYSTVLLASLSAEEAQRRRADDIGDVLLLGRVRQVAASELHRRLGER